METVDWGYLAEQIEIIKTLSIVGGPYGGMDKEKRLRSDWKFLFEILLKNKMIALSKSSKFKPKMDQRLPYYPFTEICDIGPIEDYEITIGGTVYLKKFQNMKFPIEKTIWE